jgi:hypothetical protein
MSEETKKVYVLVKLGHVEDGEPTEIVGVYNYRENAISKLMEIIGTSSGVLASIDAREMYEGLNKDKPFWPTRMYWVFMNYEIFEAELGRH